MSTHAPALTGKLSLFSVVLFGLAYMSPAIAMLTFGVIASASDGAAPTAYIIATAAMSLTALSYGKMARIMPKSGSVYSYARRMLDSRVGFLAGWAILLDYFFLPMVAWLIQSLYLNAQFPFIPVWGWLIVNIVVTTVVNLLGIVLADRVTKGLITLTALALVAFVVVCLSYLAGGNAPESGLTDPFWNAGTSVGAVSGAAAIAAYSFLGFDAISTMSEETRRPERTIPRAIVLAVLVGGAIFVVMTYVMELVYPGGQFDDASTASYAMSVEVGGKVFADIVNLAIIVGGFASGLAIQASTSRLLYVMGRDAVLPKRIFGYLHPAWKTPAFSLLLVGAAGFIALGLSLDTAASLINFGAFLAFTLVNVCVIAYFIRQRTQGIRRSVLGFVVLPVLGALVDLYLLTQLGPLAIGLGAGWLVLGIAYLAFLTKGFRTSPPEMHLDAEDVPETVAQAAY